MIKTSVIVPVYNTAKYLKECFDSIFNQTQTEIEVIAVNDGSTDDSLQILGEIKKEHPEMIIFSQENKGPGGARNKGMELSTGQFIYFIDSDDCLHKNALETCYQYASQNQLDIVMFDAEEFGNTGYESNSYDRCNIIKKQYMVFSGEEFAGQYWINTFSPTVWMTYISSDFIRKHKLNFLSSLYYEDNEFYCRAILQAERVMYIPRKLYKRRYRNGSITMSPFDQRHAEDFLKMIQAVHKLNYNEKKESILYELKNNFLRVLYNRCNINKLLNDNKFTENFYYTALDIYGGNIVKISLYHEIHILYQLSRCLRENRISMEEKQLIRKRKKEILETLFADIPMKRKNKKIGIYGTGLYTERFLNIYRENLGEISAQLIFIDSYAATGVGKYKGCDVFNVNDIEKISLECIIITSSIYEEEIFEIMKEKYKEMFKIVRLKSDLRLVLTDD